MRQNYEIFFYINFLQNLMDTIYYRIPCINILFLLKAMDNYGIQSISKLKTIHNYNLFFQIPGIRQRF